MSEIKNLAPHLVWEIFDQITQVPRPSKKEQKIIEYLENFAKVHGLDYQKDSIGNLVIIRPASLGMENRPTVVLQSHMDMVCEKNSDTVFDFENDPIQPYVDDGWVKAKGTTLGADDGIGMAAALAILIDTNLALPKIEALFTVDEETGLTGAFNLGNKMITGKYLINLDSEDEGEIFIGCAGGVDTVANFEYEATESPEGLVFFRVDINGLTGGHSGDDIDKGLANANKLLFSFLWKATHEVDLYISEIDGGNLRNAIPREAFCVFGVPTDSVTRLIGILDAFSEDVKEEYSVSEPNLNISLSESMPKEHIIDKETQRNLIYAMQGVQNGVLAMSRSIPGLVETSTNTASVKMKDEGKIVVTSSQRSSSDSAKLDAAASIQSVFELAGAHVEHSEGYPGWRPDTSSRLLAVCKEVYSELFDKDPIVRAIHAGLECGLFLKKYPDLEMISIGPTVKGAHSPDERLEIETVDMFWRLLVATLEKLD